MSDEPKKRSQGKGLSRTMPVTLFVVFAVYQGADYLPAQQSSPKPITLQAIIESMEARQRLADSVTVRWRKSTRYVPGGHFTTQTEFTYPCEMLLKGAFMRNVNKLMDMRKGVKGVPLVDRVTSYNGDESRILRSFKPPLGTIREEKRNIDVDDTHLMAFMLYFRPLAEPYDALRRESLKLVDESKIIDGHECVTVDDGRTRVYLDRNRDFIPLAFQRYLRPGWIAAASDRPGDVLMDGSVEYYRMQSAMPWLPKAFQVTMHRSTPGTADRTRGDGVQTTIGVPLKDSDFTLTFNPGTVVWDARTREEYRIRDDGSKEITKQRRKPAPPK